MNNRKEKKLVIRNMQPRGNTSNAPAKGEDTSRTDASGTDRGQMSVDPKRSDGKQTEPPLSKSPNAEPQRQASAERPSFQEVQQRNKKRFIDDLRERSKPIYRRCMPPRRNDAPTLPIHAKKADIMKAVLDNQIIIVQGETGCGKSTQIPQFMVELLINQRQHGQVFCTQPRYGGSLMLRMKKHYGDGNFRQQAASSLCNRVRWELRMTGKENQFVGHHHGGAKEFGDDTSLLYLTEGVLLQYLLSDWQIGRCGILVLDEVHERDVQMDLLIAFLKTFVLPARPELRLIVMSATLSVPALQKYFGVGDEETIVLEGRCFTVTRRYVHTPRQDYLAAALQLIIELEHGTSNTPARGEDTSQSDASGTGCGQMSGDPQRSIGKQPGDVLVFLPGQEDVDQLVAQIRRSNELKHRVVALAAYSSLPPEELAWMEMPIHQLVAELKLHHNPTRKVIAATNIAETSLTIDGVRHVIDSQYQKIDRYCVNTGATELVKVRITKAQSSQRAGRAGRTTEGNYYALCAESDYEEAAEVPIPAIQRCEPMEWFLRLKMLGVNPLKLDYLGPPPSDHMRDAITQLYLTEVLDCHFNVTDMGQKIGRFPVHPKMARALLESARRNCIEDVFGLACLLGEENRIFMRSRPKPRYYQDGEGDAKFDEAAQKKAQQEFNHEIRARFNFYDQQGDFFTLIHVWRLWRTTRMDQRRGMCFEKGINWKYMKYAERQYDKMWKDVQKLRGCLNAVAKGEDTSRVDASGTVHGLMSGDPKWKQPTPDDPINYGAIRESMVAGFASNIARFVSPGCGYKLLLQTPAYAPTIELDSRSVLSGNCELYSMAVPREEGDEEAENSSKPRAPDFPQYVLFHRLAEGSKPNYNTMRTCMLLNLEEMDVGKIKNGRLELRVNGEYGEFVIP